MIRGQDMDILTNIVAAEEDELEAVAASSRPLAEWSGVERHDIDTRMIAELHSLLTGEELDLALESYEPVYVADEGAVVLRLAESAIERLANLEDEDIEPIAEELAAIEEFELADWDASAAYDWLIELADLARLAQAQEQSIFIWMQRSMG
jgi:hypothetical protein